MGSIQYQAQQNVLGKFKDNNIKIMDVGDLYERREDGTVVFNNPDDPNRPFGSRAEAQTWIDSMNRQIRAAFDQEVYNETQRIYSGALPAINLLKFAPIYDAMDKPTQDIFDDLIEPYSIVNGSGEVIGFNCNLATMARQAIQMVQRYGIGQGGEQPAQQQKQKDQASGPAMDLKSGNGSSADDAEPANLAEALMMVNKQKRSGKDGR